MVIGGHKKQKETIIYNGKTERNLNSVFVPTKLQPLLIHFNLIPVFILL